MVWVISEDVDRDVELSSSVDSDDAVSSVDAGL